MLKSLFNHQRKGREKKGIKKDRFCSSFNSCNRSHLLNMYARCLSTRLLITLATQVVLFPFTQEETKLSQVKWQAQMHVCRYQSWVWTVASSLHYLFQYMHGEKFGETRGKTKLKFLAWCRFKTTNSALKKGKFCSEIHVDCHLICSHKCIFP